MEQGEEQRAQSKTTLVGVSACGEGVDELPPAPPWEPPGPALAFLYFSLPVPPPAKEAHTGQAIVRGGFQDQG